MKKWRNESCGSGCRGGERERVEYGIKREMVDMEKKLVVSGQEVEIE